LLGWNPGTEQEVFTMDGLLKEFSLEKIQKSGAIFDIEKLKWFQKEHRKLLDSAEVRNEIMQALEGNESILSVVKRSHRVLEDFLERFVLTSDLLSAIREGEYDFYKQVPEVTKEGLTWKKDSNPETVGDRLAKLYELLSDVDGDTFMYDVVKDAVWEYAGEVGKGDVLWPMRYALSGKERSPDPFLLAEALGKDETLKRIQKAQSLYL